MEKQMTAVNYLINEFSAILGKITTDILFDDAIMKAKELERQQIEDAFKSARIKYEINDYGTFGYPNSEQYFNQTFK